MQQRRRGVMIALTVLVGLLVLGCTCTQASNDLKVVGKNEAAVGERVQFSAFIETTIITGDRAEPQNVTSDTEWAIVEGPAKSPAGATISPDGVFVATKPGTYNVQARWNGRSALAAILIGDDTPGNTNGDPALSVDEQADPATVEQIFLSGNDAAVSNGGKPVSFTLTEPRRIREIGTYHWNDAKGTSGGGTIFLDGPGGKRELAVTRTGEGQGGVPNAYWRADVDFVLEPGTYTISDSDPSTWAQNELTQGKGHAWVMAEKK